MIDYTRFKALADKGYCCSQIVLRLGLEDAGLDDNPQLIQAVAGLCGGLHSGLDCGILSGASCLIALCLPEEAAALIRELVAWFRSEYAAETGGINCDDILAGEEINRVTKCPQILAATYEKAWELLEEKGYGFEAD